MNLLTWWTLTISVIFLKQILAATRIVGGKETLIQQAPYQVSLLRPNHFCGGSIISFLFILTACHCIEAMSEQQKFNLSIRCGSSTRNGGGTVIKVIKIICHPDYDSPTVDYDIALLKLAKELTLSPVTQPVKLATTSAKAGITCIVSGWGKLSDDDVALPSKLQSVSVLVCDWTECQEKYGTLTNRMICAGDPEGGKDSCQGDSGGPLVRKEKNGNYTQYGIVSFGSGCGDAEYLGIYTEVSCFYGWIQETMNKNLY